MPRHVARIAIPNLAEAAKHADGARALHQLARVLVAAHLHRLEAGSFPADAAPLAKHLGGALPTDPFEPGKPLRYAFEQDEVRCWSVGLDLKDDGGPAASRWAKGADRKDLVLTTRAP